MWISNLLAFQDDCMDEQKKRIYDLEIVSGSSHFDECNECKKRVLIPCKRKLT